MYSGVTRTSKKISPQDLVPVFMHDGNFREESVPTNVKPEFVVIHCARQPTHLAVGLQNGRSTSEL